MSYLADMYFYSNACHVCKVYGKKVQLKRCAGCKTIAYCSKEHQSKHWPRHKDLCKLLTEIVRRAGTIFGFRDRRESSMTSWTRAKTNLMLLLQMKLGRKLEPYETEMFKFPRACKICHETDPQRLTDCPDCPGTSFCLDHQLENNHDTKCSALKLCFDVETTQLPFDALNQKIISQFQGDNIPKNMQELVDLYLFQSNGTSISPKIKAVCVSECLTRPLTFLYTLKQLNCPKLELFNVHVIGANALEMESLLYWETLLHCQESMIELRMVLIGPELCQQNYEMDLCESCTAKKKKLYVQTVDMLYTDYVASKNFVEPDFIIGFNLGIHECENVASSNDTWAPSLKELTRRDCPFVMTSYTLQESQEEQKRLCNVLNNHVESFYSGKNPFSSLRPYRDFESEDFFYQNNYITIYKKLC